MGWPSDYDLTCYVSHSYPIFICQTDMKQEEGAGNRFGPNNVENVFQRYLGLTPTESHRWLQMRAYLALPMLHKITLGDVEEALEWGRQFQ